MLLKKVALIISSLFDKFKRDNFWAPFLKASEVTPKNGGGEGSISILVGNSYTWRIFNSFKKELKIRSSIEFMMQHKDIASLFQQLLNLYNNKNNNN